MKLLMGFYNTNFKELAKKKKGRETLDAKGP